MGKCNHLERTHRSPFVFLIKSSIDAAYFLGVMLIFFILFSFLFRLKPSFNLFGTDLKKLKRPIETTSRRSWMVKTWGGRLASFFMAVLAAVVASLIVWWLVQRQK